MTTSLEPPDTVAEHARSRSVSWGLPFVERRKLGLSKILRDSDAAAALVFTRTGLAIGSHTTDTEVTLLRPHLSTAEIRLRSLRRGEGDPLVRAGEIAAGDTVLDCTYGLGRDAAVAAFAAGPNGRVTGLESSKALAYMAAENPVALEGAADIDVHLANACSWLEAAQSNSVDVVLIDPMFSAPTTSDATFELLRNLADNTPLTPGWVDHAARIARRWVVVKSSRHLDWFDDAGLEPVHSHGNARYFRRPAIEGEHLNS